MAYAKAAELNGYPGPSHVLELAGQLQLNDQQRQATQSLMDQHKTRARELGTQLVEAERQLDIAFASKTVDAHVVDDLTRQIGLLQARLRAETFTDAPDSDRHADPAADRRLPASARL